MSQLAKFTFNNPSDSSHGINLTILPTEFSLSSKFLIQKCSVKIFISLLAGLTLADCSLGVNLTRGIKFFYGGETERDVLHMNDES